MQRTIFRSGIAALAAFGIALVSAVLLPMAGTAAKPLDNFEGRPPVHVGHHSSSGPVGLSPATIKAVYNLAGAGNGSGTIAIIDAFDSPTVQADLNTFSTQYGLPKCTSTNPCFEKHTMAPRLRADGGWALEASLDTQWAHAIAPGAKILLVEARSASGSDLLNAVAYARSRSDVVAISMSWGGGEFSSEAAYDSSFTSGFGATFFASSGDSGAGVSWPAVSPNVIGVGGTTLTLNNGAFANETAWSGSGGGVSQYEPQPAYQAAYGVSSNSKRAVPDVSYDADPGSGVSVYDSTSYQGQTGWFQVGGTSAGAPQWAAIKALGGNLTNQKVYQDAQANSAAFFRDITSGSNGSCGVLCTAAAGYDTVTGLGSPITAAF